MAPSRALLAQRIFAIAQPHIRPTTRLPTRTLLVSSCNRTSSALPHGPSYPTTSPASCTRSYSQQATTTPEPPEYLNEAELHIFNKIKDSLDPVKLEVQDVSGGCGSMYAIEIESAKFKGLTPVKQHKLVNEVLKEEIAQWHGVQLRLKAV